MRLGVFLISYIVAESSAIATPRIMPRRLEPIHSDHPLLGRDAEAARH